MARSRFSLKPAQTTEGTGCPPELYINANNQENFRYRYDVKYKEGIFKAAATYVFNSLTGRKDDKHVQERRWRKLNKGMKQYDIFHNPDEKHFNRNVFLGQMFFIQMLFRKLSCDSDFRQLFIECEHVGFGHLGYASEDIKSCLTWIQEAMSKNATPLQGLYVCCVLGQLVDHGRSWSAEHVTKCLGRKTVDFILSSFENVRNVCLPRTRSKVH